ncbi:MAG: single-stranded-DNA-specific exonuclease RecJ [Desulfobacterales bacterium]|nr:single-stranded-DNA-specific exonuclease RecJ [Desulfobacterales bacterium]
MEKNLKILKPDPNAIQEIYRCLGCHPVTAAVLVNRNLVCIDDVKRYLSPSFKHLRAPDSIVDMQPAVDRIAQAIYRKEPILVFGDYDVDGITSTVLLYEFLKLTGAKVSYYIPHRIEEGYSLKPEQIKNIADSSSGIRLIITVDCGSNSHEAIEAARKAGIDVIITDHHHAAGNLPDAIAIVNPKREDCQSGLDHLAGVGVVFYLIISLRKYLREKGFWHSRTEPNLKQMCDLVALGTIADVVPLKDENRVFVKAGLEIIQSGTRLGLKSLAKASGFFKQVLDSEDIAFRLAPRLNAAGRIEHAEWAAKLLMTDQEDRAAELARFLNELNIQRQEFEQNTFDDILNRIHLNPDLLCKKALVMESSHWHEGILGIVASRLAERFFKPTILITVRDGFGKGSCRSIPGFDLYPGLCQCSALLEDFGGHSMAAGIKIKTSNIDSFKESFHNIVSAHMQKETPVPELIIDCELSFDDINEHFIDEIEALKPFGSENPEPVFLAGNIAVSDPKIVGQNHRRMLLSQPGGLTQKKFNAIHFNVDSHQHVEGFLKFVAFRLKWNRWNGNKSAQIIIEEIG